MRHRYETSETRIPQSHLSFGKRLTNTSIEYICEVSWFKIVKMLLGAIQGDKC